MVVETPSPTEPTKKTSPIFGWIWVVDRVGSLDDEDVRGMTADNISAMLVRKARRWEKRITVLWQHGCCLDGDDDEVPCGPACGGTGKQGIPPPWQSVGVRQPLELGSSVRATPHRIEARSFRRVRRHAGLSTISGTLLAANELEVEGGKGARDSPRSSSPVVLFV